MLRIPSTEWSDNADNRAERVQDLNLDLARFTEENIRYTVTEV